MILSTALLVLTIAAEPPPARLNHRRAAPPPAVNLDRAHHWFVEGILRRGEDGRLVIERPLPRALRLAAARAQHRPLSAVPSAARQMVALAPQGPALVLVERRLGSRVRAELTRDPSGQTFLVGLYAPQLR